MLAEFDRARTKFVEERKAEQQQADRMCGKMYEDLGKMLQGGKKERRPIIAFITELGLHGSLSPQSEEVLTPREIANSWTLSRDVDFDGETHEVTIKAYGDKNPNKATRSFMWVDGVPDFIEVTKDSGVMWEEEKRGKRTHIVRKQRANIVEASFFEGVLNRFYAQTGSK